MEPTLLITLAFIPVIIIALFVCAKFNITLPFGIKLSFVNDSNKIRERLSEVIELVRNTDKLIYSYNNNIYSNQRAYLEGKLTLIVNQCKLTSCDKYQLLVAENLARLSIKNSIKENGFAAFNEANLKEYINNKIGELQRLFTDCLGTNSFILCNEFNTIIYDIFNHAADCTRYWSSKVVEVEQDYSKQLNKIMGKDKK